MTPRLKHYSFWQTGHCHPFSTWQAGQTRKGTLLCKQCPDGRFLQNACWDEFPKCKLKERTIAVSLPATSKYLTSFDELNDDA